MAGGRGLQALVLVLIMMMAPLAGCFGENENDGVVRSGDVTITPVTMIGGVFQGLTISAEQDLSAFVPYLIQNQESGFIQNSTVVDLRAGESVLLNVLAPPRTDTAVVLLGDYGREEWPIRSIDESWKTWYDRSGFEAGNAPGIVRVDGENGTLDTVMSSNNSGGDVLAIRIAINRPMAAAYGEADGGRHSTGLVDGLNVFNYISHMSDETADPTDAADGAVGYLDRWAGQGNAAYEDAAQYLIGNLESFGLEVIVQRFTYDSLMTGAQNPEAYNICGYRFGDVNPDKWMVFGAHFDIAPPVNGGMLDPHIFGRTYGTRVGAYDNTAGTAMVLTVAEAMANFDTRNTMVFCLWSGEEGGKRGSDFWTDYWVKEDNPNVEVTNYVNLDMAGVNWPGGGGAPCGNGHGGGDAGCDPQPEIDPDGYPKDEEVWPMRVYIGPSLDHDIMNQPGMVGLAMWIGSDAIGVEEQMAPLLGAGHSADTWKVDDWMAKDRPEIIVYEDTTARSDHATFQDNLGTVTMGFGGLVDGYWCYHQTCDTVDEMIDWMDTTGKDYGEEQSGTSNLVDALDTITWWATYSFFHLDENPVRNAYL
ncbi:MAG TPA: M28 family peptidase [Candidatus Poseidoniales archaeon]|nr:MAG TPA: M28 family peptidase [Candidatus Poseidoniales archaeon]HII21321.1 M28 family peptidase [Candidatus Poseidoniaceae archaeon]|tara:strand:- start:226 stop:1992 length:1767 start_codon:yes stop_codon:yes gene_type:complete